MTGFTLALVEASAVFAAGCATAWSSRSDAAVLLPATIFLPAAALAVVCVTAFYYNDLYDLRSVSSLARFAARLPKSVAVALLLLALLHVVVPQGSLGRLAWTLLLSLALLLLLRMLSYRLIRNPAFVERVLILGASPLARALIEEIGTRPECGYAIAGVADDPTGVNESSVRFRWRGASHPLATIIEQVQPRRILVALADRRGHLPIRQLMESRLRTGIAVEDAAEAYERLTGKVAIEALSPSSLVFSRDVFAPRLGLLGARVVGRVVAAGALVALLPLLGLIALAIKLDSRGRVLFVQDRVGFRGERFRLIKFRTMHPPAEPRSEWVLDNRDRITRVGKWLRTFRLDELPQFVNVLRGELDLVGPRPHPASNLELFMQAIPHYWLRFAVRPGITGWAQVRYGYANNLEEETEKMRYDLYYIKHRSPWLDLRILLDTVKTVSLGRGAAAATARRSPAVEPLPRTEFGSAA